jgi:hypothetical protein
MSCNCRIRKDILALQSEYRDDRGIAYLADELRPERSQHLLYGPAIAQHGQVRGHVKSLGALMQAISISCLLRTSA